MTVVYHQLLTATGSIRIHPGGILTHNGGGVRALGCGHAAAVGVVAGIGQVIGTVVAGGAAGAVGPGQQAALGAVARSTTPSLVGNAL